MMGGTLLRNILNVWGNDYKATAAKPPEGLSEYYKKSNFPPYFDTWRLNDNCPKNLHGDPFDVAVGPFVQEQSTGTLYR
ncbi:hypothetical protein QOT17_010576 [Balamuthia mandrillaris]